MGRQSSKKIREMKYLFLGGHSDEEICFAGLMLKVIDQGHEVMYMISDFGTSNVKEFHASTDVLGCKVDLHPLDGLPAYNDYLYSQYKDNVDFVVTHDISDRHPVHRKVAEESRRIFNCSMITYVAPWNENENPNYFVEISGAHLEKKIQALACYKSQEHRRYMDPDFIRSWARYNGVKAGVLYAEAFKIAKLVEKL